MTEHAELFFRAATHLRERASKATPGPYRAMVTPEGVVVERRNDDLWQPVAYAGEGEQAERDAVYIATVHREVGLALAGMLERQGQLLNALPTAMVDPVVVEAAYSHELAVARAVLGETAAQPDAVRPA